MPERSAWGRFLLTCLPSLRYARRALTGAHLKYPVEFKAGPGAQVIGQLSSETTAA